MVANSNEIAKSMESSPYERLELPCDEAARRAAVRLKLSLTSHRLEGRSGTDFCRMLPIDGVQPCRCSVGPASGQLLPFDTAREPLLTDVQFALNE
jgi:hypothetical protein